MIPQVVSVGGNDNTAPIIVLQALEKDGKSATSGTTLAGWQGKEPLFLAWDRTGPDSCLRLGYSPKAIRIPDLPGQKVDPEGRVADSFWAKGRAALAILESNRAEIVSTYNALIVDCTSTMSDRLFEEARRFSKNPDPRSHYGDVLLWCSEFMNRVVDIGLPTVWLAWMKPAETVQDKNTRGQTTTRLVPGGPLITGNFKVRLAGKAHHIAILTKEKHTPETPGADDEGFVRMLRTKPWNNVTAGGRYSHVLPDPMPAHLGVLFASITGKGREQYPWYFK